MITTEIDGIIRCDQCGKTREAVTIPISVSTGGGIGVHMNQIVLPDGWKRVETRLYRKLIVCNPCGEKFDDQNVS